MLELILLLDIKRYSFGTPLRILNYFSKWLFFPNYRFCLPVFGIVIRLGLCHRFTTHSVSDAVRFKNLLLGCSAPDSVIKHDQFQIFS
jgi:hypothetical protein